MEQRELTVALRSESGSAAARRLRRRGLVPAVLYGRGSEPLALAVGAHSLREVTHGGRSLILRLNIENGGAEAPTAIIKEIQRDALTGAALNVDFQRISLTEKISAQVPVVLAGEAPGIKKGGVLEQVLREVQVECLPMELPDRILVDVSHLEIAHSIHVSDITAPPGVTITSEPGDVIATVLVPRVVQEAVPAAPAEAAAEGVAPEEGEEAGRAPQAAEEAE